MLERHCRLALGIGLVSFVCLSCGIPGEMSRETSVEKCLTTRIADAA